MNGCAWLGRDRSVEEQRKNLPAEETPCTKAGRLLPVVTDHESLQRFYQSCDQPCLLRKGKVLERPSYLFSLS